MKHRCAYVGGLSIFLAMACAAASAQEKPAGNSSTVSVAGPQGAPTLQTPNPRYQIRIGDALEITFAFTPEYNQTVTVQPDGFVNLRDLPDLHVAGMTTPELRARLRTEYGKILHDPVLTVLLRDFEKPYFVVGGQVGRPGKFDLRGDTTVVQALAIAGGLTESSKHSQVLLFRRISSEWTEVKVLDVKEMMHRANLSEDVHLSPGDMLFVPQNLISKIKRFIPTASIGIYTNSF